MRGRAAANCACVPLLDSWRDRRPKGMEVATMMMMMMRERERERWGEETERKTGGDVGVGVNSAVGEGKEIVSE